MYNNMTSYKYFMLLIIVLLFSCQSSNSQVSQNKVIMNRKSVYAGSFYSANKASLQKDLSVLFSQAKSQIAETNAIISPHAGYVFSGSVAASAFNQIDAQKQYDNVFILTASHKAYFEGAALYNKGNYETPLGEVKVNIDLCNKLIDENKVFNSNIAAHKDEHTIEVQLPFLQYHLKNNFQIVPIIIGNDGVNSSKQIAQALKPYFNENNLFIISSDFSHYPQYQKAIDLDDEVADAICSGNTNLLISIISKYKQTKIKNLSTNLCGFSAVLVLMYLADNENYTYNKIDYKNSGDSSYGDKEQVVGYWAISVSKKNNNSFVLLEEEKLSLLETARLALETKLKHKQKLDLQIQNYSSTLKSHCGAFVSLYKKSKLRGCVGMFEPGQPLISVVADMAISAALYDNRFQPVALDELENIEIEISVLSPMRKIQSIDEIELGKHGIYIIKGRQAGTFLPQVAVETGWSKEEFLGHCARDKAGLSYTGWKDADIYIYEAIVFSEKELKKNKTKIASYFNKLENNKIECSLCPHKCILSDGQAGLCRARKNIKGTLYSLSYGKPVSINIDPIEKKPLYHYLPASKSLSFGTAGCNLHCKNCQNSSISQVSPEAINYIDISPEEIVDLAIKNDCKSISYTYTEPTIFYEFMLETAKLANKKGLKNIIVSNGFINEAPLLELMPYIDAANIDLKCFNDSLYQALTTASLSPVLNTIKLLKLHNKHLEITNLIIPNYTDDMRMISDMCDWLIENKLSDVPLHFSRFFPAYKMNKLEATPISKLEQAVRIAKSKGLIFVYLGNVGGNGTNTICHKCGTILIQRSTSNVYNFMNQDKCSKCEEVIPGYWGQ